MRDIVVVGGGVAGLVAAWAARDADVLLLEKEQRVGGRLRSERRGRYWLNWGAHVLAGPGSATDVLIGTLGLRAVAVPGKLDAVAMNGRMLAGGRVETYPFRIPMSWGARLAALRAGARVRTAVVRYGRMLARAQGQDYWLRQQLVLDFMGASSFREFVGSLPEDADALLRPTVTRSGGEPEEISAGAGIGYFRLVWNRGEGLSRNILGGSATLSEALAARLQGRVLLGAEVTTVALGADHVEVVYANASGSQASVRARYVVMATPAPVTLKLVRPLPTDLARTLERIVYGPYVSAAFLTSEGGAAPWDDCYAIATPKRSFNVFFNMSSAIRGMERERSPGSSIMVFSPARLARALLDRDDREIIAIYLADLDQLFPGFSALVSEAQIQRWPLGLAYCFPGRGALQGALLRPRAQFALAGDYLGNFYTETAVQSGLRAARLALAEVGA